MTALDIILAVPLAVLVFLGWKRGLMREVATLAGVLAGIWAAVHLSQKVVELLSLEGESAILIAFFICFVGAIVLAYFLGRGVENLMKAAKIGTVNRLAGAVLGMAKALCIISVLLNYLILLDTKETILKPTMKEESVLYKPVYSTGNKLTASLKEYIAEHREEWKKHLITEKESE